MRAALLGFVMFGGTSLACTVGLPDRLPESTALATLSGDGGTLDGAPPVCEPHFEQLPNEQWRPIAAQKVCDDTTLRTALRCTLDPLFAQGPECTQLAASKDACLACVGTNALSGFQGPLFDFGYGPEPNIPGCVAILSGDTSAKSCGSRVLARSFCEQSYCGGCDENSDWMACYDKIDQTTCAPHVAVTRECEQYFDPCGESQLNINDAFVTVGRVFCGK